MRYSDYAFLVRFTLLKCRTEYGCRTLCRRASLAPKSAALLGVEQCYWRYPSYPKEPIPRLAVIKKFSGSACPVPKSEHVRTEVNGGIKKP